MCPNDVLALPAPPPRSDIPTGCCKARVDRLRDWEGTGRLVDSLMDTVVKAREDSYMMATRVSLFVIFCYFLLFCCFVVVLLLFCFFVLIFLCVRLAMRYTIREDVRI